QVVLMLMNALYPIKAAHISNNGLIYINRGNDGGLFVGEELAIYKPGQAIIDPDTGEQLGVEESYVGKVVVTEVEDARSKGEQIEGTGIVRGDLLKRTANNKNKRSSVASHASQTAPKRSGATVGKKTTGKGPSTLAMGIIHLNQSARTINGFNQGYLERISDDIITGLSNSKRFTLMEREQVDQILDEKAFETITSGGDIQARLGELVGADYLIHGELNNFYINTTRKKVPYIDEIQTISTTHGEGVFRIADVHTGAIISSEKITINEKLKGVSDHTQIISKMIAQFSTKSVAKIVARLYPVKVMGSSADGAIYLNRGEDSGIKVGEHYAVMRPGQALIDPDTGESFGQAESKIAMIKITEVEGARSRAQLISGADPVNGDILRKPVKPVKKPKQKIMQPNW
ncbi:MAG: CsgG/HfaB family protein, partial [gamma proteobacterium symbiont of Bathyaustriella thionipta]|nr:CsgG/HfaB family protein [gamma proteobacterium symbiont of Bathyaustriella thionipta]